MSLGPGSLSRGINRQAMTADIPPFSVRSSVHRAFAFEAMDSHKSLLLVPYCLEISTLFQSSESKHEGSAFPFIFIATLRTK